MTWHSSGGSSGGSWGSSGGSSGGSWGSSGGSSGGSHGGEVMEGDSAPAPEGTAPPADGAAPAEAGAGVVAPSDDSVALEVEVPAEARVFVNGHETTSTGGVRRFVSRGLEPGYSYSYEIRAEIERDGETVSETKVVKLLGGQAADVNFTFENVDGSAENVASTPEENRTTLLLRVPAEAKVFLAGRETQSTGEVREFSTTRLGNGQEWADYTVRVEMEQDGQTLTKEQTVSLRSGETKELSIDFDAASIAQVSR